MSSIQRLTTPLAWRRAWLLLAGGCLAAAALWLPVPALVDHAIPRDVMQMLQAKGTPQRIQELREQFREGLQYFRVAAGMLGAWSLALGLMLPWLVSWNARWPMAPASSKDEGSERVLPKEWWTPGILAGLVALLALPLLWKGFEHQELLNLDMLAKRGVLVSVACQNLPPRAAQPGFTAIESVFVRMLGDSAASARLPALILAAFVLFPLYSLARRYGDRTFAALSCAWLGVNGFFLFYATYARGYAMAMTAYIATIAVALRLRERSTWPTWIALGGLVVGACYAHLASGLYIACLCLVIVADRLQRAWRAGRRPAAAWAALIQPSAALSGAALVLFLLLALGIPAEVKYCRTFSLTEYYTSYHVNGQFLAVMAELWSWVHGVPALAWAGVGLAVAGGLFALRHDVAATAYLVGPPVAAGAVLAAKHLFVYPRFFLQFLPLYALLVMVAIWRLVTAVPCLRQRAGRIAIAGIVFIAAAWSLPRLYVADRCGVQPAVEEARQLMRPGDRLMAVLDAYVTVRHYLPDAETGYTAQDFWSRLRSDDPPEYILSVPYLEVDIPGATEAMRRQYRLWRTYPSWLDVKDNRESVFLYVRRDIKRTTSG